MSEDRPTFSRPRKSPLAFVRSKFSNRNGVLFGTSGVRAPMREFKASAIRGSADQMRLYGSISSLGSTLDWVIAVAFQRTVASLGYSRQHHSLRRSVAKAGKWL